MVFNVLDTLGDVLGGGTDTADGKENIVLQEVTSEHLDVTGESGREHECLAVVDLRHVFALNDTTNLRLETHV